MAECRYKTWTNPIQARWRKDQFRNQKFTKGWTEAEDWNNPSWSNLKEILNENRT